MTTVKSQTHTQLPTRSWLLSRIFFLILVLATLTTSARATIFGVSTARLSYDIVSVKNNPTDIENLDLVMAGDDLPVALIAKTANIPKDGLFVSPDFLPLFTVDPHLIPQLVYFLLRGSMTLTSCLTTCHVI